MTADTFMLVFSAFLTHDVQDVVSDFSGCDGALLGVHLQNLQHGLQFVQRAVLTLLADELSTYSLKRTCTVTLGLSFR